MQAKASRELPEVRHARLVKPFPTKRLADSLYHVIAEAHSISSRLEAILRDPPTLPDAWTAELYWLDESLRSLRARCGDALPVLEEMVDRADSDFNRGLDAVVAMMRGLAAEYAEQEKAA